MRINLQSYEKKSRNFIRNFFEIKVVCVSLHPYYVLAKSMKAAIYGDAMRHQFIKEKLNN